MSCSHCGKNMKGNFIAINPAAFLEDKTKSSVIPPKGKKVKLDILITSHSTRYQRTSMLDLIPKMRDFTNSMITQTEEYFCSKKCLLAWFEKLLKKLPNP